MPHALVLVDAFMLDLIEGFLQAIDSRVESAVVLAIVIIVVAMIAFVVKIKIAGLPAEVLLQQRLFRGRLPLWLLRVRGYESRGEAVLVVRFARGTAGA